MLLYQAHLLVFVTAALQILFADVDGSGEVYSVGMFRISSGFDDGMFYDKFAKVIENDPGIYFLCLQSPSAVPAKALCNDPA